MSPSSLRRARGRVPGSSRARAPQGPHTRAQGQSSCTHMLRSCMVLAMRMRLILQLKAPGAPENRGAPLVTPLNNQIQTQRKSAPYFAANRSLLSQPSSFSCTTAGQSRQTPAAQARPAPKRSLLWGTRHHPLSCLDQWAPSPGGCAPQKTGTCFLGQQLHPNFNRNTKSGATPLLGQPWGQGVQNWVLPPSQILQGPSSMLPWARQVSKGSGASLLPAAVGSAGAPRGSSRHWSPHSRLLRALLPLRPRLCRPHCHRAGC